MFAQLLTLYISLFPSISDHDATTLDQFKFYNYKSAVLVELTPVIPRVVHTEPTCFVAYDSVLSQTCTAVPLCGEPRKFVYSSSILRDLTFCYHTTLVPGAIDKAHSAYKIMLNSKPLTMDADTYKLTSLPSLPPNNDFILLLLGQSAAITTTSCYSRFHSVNGLPAEASISFSNGMFQLHTEKYHSICRLYYVPVRDIYMHLPSIVQVVSSETALITKLATFYTFNTTDTYVTRINDDFVISNTLQECARGATCVIMRNVIDDTIISVHPETISVYDSFGALIMRFIGFFISLFFHFITISLSYLSNTYLGAAFLSSTLYFCVLLTLLLLSTNNMTTSVYLSFVILAISVTARYIFN